MVPTSINTAPRVSSSGASSPESAPPAVVETPESSSDLVPEDSSLEPSIVEKNSTSRNPARTRSSSASSRKNGALQDDMSRRREQIRAKLRASEEKLRTFATAASDDLNHMVTVQADLKKMKNEKSQLEVELNQLKCATDNGGDNFLQEQMIGIQQGLEAQVHKIQSLQEELQAKEDEIECLHEELVHKIRRIVELEFDLETHEVHYTNYSAEQFKLGEDALEEIKRMRAMERRSTMTGNMTPFSSGRGTTTNSKKDSHLGSSSSSFTGSPVQDTTSVCSSRVTAASLTAPKKTQQLITKLLADLDDLEDRYKNDRLDSATQLQQVNLLNKQLRTRIEVLEAEVSNKANCARCHAHEQDGKTSTGTSSDAPAGVATISSMFPGNETNQFLRVRVKTLEARRALASKDVERVQREYRSLKKTYMSEKEDNKMMVEGLRTENDALRARITQLESSASLASAMPESSKKPRRRRSLLGGLRSSSISHTNNGQSLGEQQQHYEEIEQRIQEAFNKLFRLEAERDIKDRQISTLKNEVTTLRMKDVTNGKLDGTDFSPLDTEILRSPASRRVTYDASVATSSSNVGGAESASACDTRSNTTDPSLLSAGVHDDCSNSYVVDLQLQLQEAQELLVKKDQELVIERAKSASTAAGLLARITEVTGCKVDSRSGKELTLPLKYQL